MQPSELDKLEFYRLEMLMQNLKERNDKAAEQQKTNDKNSPESNAMSDAKSMMRDAQKSISSMKMPKF
jgi:hypothetical protein